jgi:hypothetical protein
MLALPFAALLLAYETQGRDEEVVEGSRAGSEKKAFKIGKNRDVIIK